MLASTWGPEAEGWEFEASLGCVVRPCVRKLGGGEEESRASDNREAHCLPKLSQTVATSQYGHRTEGDEAGGLMEAVTTSSFILEVGSDQRA